MQCSKDRHSLPQENRHAIEGNIKSVDQMKGLLQWMKGKEAASTVCVTGTWMPCLCPVSWQGQGWMGGRRVGWGGGRRAGLPPRGREQP